MFKKIILIAAAAVLLALVLAVATADGPPLDFNSTAYRR